MAPKYKHLLSSTLNFLSCLPCVWGKGNWPRMNETNKLYSFTQTNTGENHIAELMGSIWKAFFPILRWVFHIFFPLLSPEFLPYSVTWWPDLNFIGKWRVLKMIKKKKKLFHFKPLEVLNHLFLPTSSYHRYISHLGCSEDMQCLKQGCCKQTSWFLCFSVIS